MTVATPYETEKDAREDRERGDRTQARGRIRGRPHAGDGCREPWRDVSSALSPSPPNRNPSEYIWSCSYLFRPPCSNCSQESVLATTRPFLMQNCPLERRCRQTAHLPSYVMKSSRNGVLYVWAGLPLISVSDMRNPPYLRSVACTMSLRGTWCRSASEGPLPIGPVGSCAPRLLGRLSASGRFGTSRS